MNKSFKRSWPWFAAIIFLVTYELFAVYDPQAITLSRMIWIADIDYPWLKWVIIAVTVILFIHFFVRKFNRVAREVHDVNE